MRQPTRVLLGLVSAVLLVLPVQAQPGGGGGGFFERTFSVPIGPREMREIGRELELGGDQEQVARMLYEGFRSQFEERAEALRSEFERVREERDWGRMREIGAKMRDFRETRETMQESFLSDLRAILTPAQEERWPRVERSLRRSQTLGRGLMRTERVDLIRIARETLGEEAELPGEVAAVLDRYEVELDRELVKRNEVFEEGWSRARELVRGGQREELDELLENAREASLRLRDLNRRFVRVIGSALPEEEREEFEALVRRAAFPDVYRETYAERALAAAEGFADLDEAQREGIEALRASYARDVQAVNGRLASAIEEWEEEASARELMPWERRRRRERPGGELWQERRELSATALESLERILTEEQVSRLPDPDEGGGRRGGGERRRDIF